MIGALSHVAGLITLVPYEFTDVLNQFLTSCIYE